MAGFVKMKDKFNNNFHNKANNKGFDKSKDKDHRGAKDLVLKQLSMYDIKHHKADDTENSKNDGGKDGVFLRHTKGLVQKRRHPIGYTVAQHALQYDSQHDQNDGKNDKARQRHTGDLVFWGGLHRRRKDAFPWKQTR